MRYRASVPGRTELAGNHQDHQGGCVIGAAIDRRITCLAETVPEQVIRVESDFCAPFELDLTSPDFTRVHPEERQSSSALVRGMAAQLIETGVPVRGCALALSSDIPPGSGLSSSAAFELVVGAGLVACAGWQVSESMDGFSMQEGALSPLKLAQMALHAERDYFDKPCGIMDQTVCASGGVVHMDFLDTEHPVVSRVELPPSWNDYAYYLVDCGSGHDMLTQDFAQVAFDMEEVAHVLDIAHLRDIDIDAFLREIGRVRLELGDLRALRGLHFYIELDLVRRRLAALESNDMGAFIDLTNQSSISSAEYLQNVGVPGHDEDAMVSLALCRLALREALQGERHRGSARIHGGGFGGTIQVIVPKAHAESFERRIAELHGRECCLKVSLGEPGIIVEPLAS